LVLDKVRSNVKDVSTYEQGKTVEDIKREFGLERIAKLCFNENPYAPYPSCLEAVENELASLNHYPDENYLEVKRLIGGKVGLEKENIALGHGAVGILETLSKLFIEEGDEVIIPKMTFGLYEELSKTLGGIITKPALTNNRIDLENILAEVTDKTKVVWLCNPNNPTGTILQKDELENFLAELPERVWVILDEAYYEFVTTVEYPEIADILAENKNVVSVRTFSKAYGMAGLRLGYALAVPEVIEAIKRISQPFNVNRAALAGAKGILNNGRYFKEAVNKIEKSREHLTLKLQELGCEVAPSQTNFVFFRTSYPTEKIAQELLHRGVMVASGERWSDDRAIRVSIGTPQENKKFLTGLREILS